MSLPLSQAHALMEIRRTPKITQQELAGRLGLSKSNVSRLVAKLVDQKRAQRKEDRDDGRAYRLVLTEKGLRLAEHLDVSSLARFQALYTGLPERERKNVTRALSLLAEATRAKP
jgi:DNA-binding MarR family transcriptional regulator